LHYVDELPLQEVARVLGRSRASVKIMIFRARRKLLPLMSEFDESRIAAQPCESGNHL
jgi:DNA-directed RNA polymerase specialized sigma24 family protein